MSVFNSDKIFFKIFLPLIIITLLAMGYFLFNKQIQSYLLLHGKQTVWLFNTTTIMLVPDSSGNMIVGETLANPYVATSSKVFSDFEADFTFEYPDLWTYQRVGKDSYSQLQNPNNKMWAFSYRDNIVMSVGAPPYETAFDGCLEPVEMDKGTSFYTKVDFLSTNDAQTTILKQVCGDVTYLTWSNGFNPKDKADLAKAQKLDPNLRRIMVLYSAGFVNKTSVNQKPPDDYLTWGDRIAKSIKIK